MRIIETNRSPRHRQAAGGRRASGTRALRARILWSLALVFAAGLLGSAGHAEDAARQQMRGLDEQVQEIKSDVLGIAAELSRLEERLLYPSDTQVSVFVSLGEGEALQLDSVQVAIDGAPVAHHIYSFKELEALQKGGVQRIYTGNLPTGEHQIEVVVAGSLAGGSAYARTQGFGFSKGVGPELVDIRLGGDGIQIGSR